MHTLVVTVKHSLQQQQMRTLAKSHMRKATKDNSSCTVKCLDCVFCHFTTCRLMLLPFFMSSKCLVSFLTFIEAIVIHVSIDVQILSSHKGEFCFRVLIWSIIWVITERRNMLF